jgi:pyruvate,water dikinase
MRKAKALITDFGSKTSHASLVAREMNLPAIVGTGDACLNLKDGQHITLELNSEIGLVYGGLKC